MRILYWTGLFPPYIGGVEVLSSQLLPALLRQGHDFRVVTSHGGLDLPDVDAFQNIQVHRFHFHRALAKGDLVGMADIRRRLLQVKREFRPDVVHINVTEPSFVFHLQTDHNPSVPLVLSFHASLPRTTLQSGTLIETGLRRAAWVTACSNVGLHVLQTAFPWLRKKSSVLFSTVQMPSGSPVAPPEGEALILCVGRLVPEKGFDAALEAFARIRVKHPAARLVIAGDGPERRSLEAQASRHGIADRVTFLGWVNPDGVLPLMRASRVVLLPSRERYEALPLVAVQAAAAARPLIASRVGALEDAVIDLETGYLVPESTPSEIARCLEVLLQDPARAGAMGAAAHRLAHSRFNFDRHVEALKEIYRGAATGPTSPSPHHASAT